MKKFFAFLSILFSVICQEIQNNDTKTNQTVSESNKIQEEQNSKQDLDFFQREIEIHENTIKLYKKKIEILKQIREHYMENKIPIMV